MRHSNAAAIALITFCHTVIGQNVEFHSPVISQNMQESGSFGVIWDTPRSTWMPKCTSAPKIDGKLEDACWEDAALLAGFVAGSTNSTRPYRNFVRLCYDATNFYVGCRLGEPNPKVLKANTRDHNTVQIWTDDCIELHIEIDGRRLFVPNYQGKPTWFQFITNTVAARFAELVCERRPGSKRFHPLPVHDQWQSAASIGEDAFVIEVAIPWKLLQIEPKDGASFRMNVGRNKPYAPEGWNTNAYHRPDRFGTVHFGRKGKEGVEIRESRVKCAGNEWTVSLNAVAASKPQKVVLQAELKQDGKVLATGKSELVTVGVKPIALVVPLRVTEPGTYEVGVKLVSEEGQALLQGHVEAKRKPLLERFFLLRRDLYPGEKVIKGYLRLTTLPQNRGLAAHFELRDGDRSLAKSAPRPLKSPEVQFDFAVPALGPGEPSFHLRVTDDQGAAVVDLDRELRVKPFTPLEREQARIHIDEPAGVARKEWPITAGIPFGKGMLRVADVDARSRVLDASGKELLCQSRVLATWTDARRYARWVLFDFQGNLEANKGADFTVEFGTAVRRARVPGEPLADEPLEGGIEIDTGPLQMSISTEEPVFFREISANGRQMTRPVQGGEMYLKLGDPITNARLQPHQHEYRIDRSTKTFLAELSKEGYAVEIEHAGPIRSVIKSTGWYGAEDGSRLFKYILRLYAHRDKSWLDCFHTVIATESEQYVHSMGLRLQGPGAPNRVLFGQETGTPLPLPFRYTEELALIQPSPEYYRVLDYRRECPDWGTQRTSGRRATGWCSLDYGNLNLLVAIKNFWQECPKELAVSSKGLLDLGFVGMRSPRHMDLRGSPFAKEEQATGNSQGVAKTTRFVLSFEKTAPGQPDLADHAKAVLADHAVWVGPDWMQRADPMWAPVARCTPESKEPAKRAYANHVSMHVLNQPGAPEVVNGLQMYGILNFGDRAHGMATRGWFNNEDYAVPYNEWVAYFATGNRRLFEAVIAFSRHLMDVDTLNYTTVTPGRLGLQSRHRRLHWGQPSIITHTYLDQSLIYYYLLGYERGADHAQLIREGQPVWTWWPSEGWYWQGNPNGAVSRDFGVNLRILMNAYRHCWAPALLVRAHELWERFSEGFMPHGDNIAGYFMIPRGLELYARYTADPPTIARILKSEELCPVLSADLGHPEKLQRWAGEAEQILANAHERLDPPWWALRFGQESHRLSPVQAIGALEKLERQGKKLPPIRGGRMKFRGDRSILFLEEKDEEHTIRLRIVGKEPNVTASVHDPGGKLVLEMKSDTKDLPPAHRGHELALTVPEDKVTGTYLLRFGGLNHGYTRAWLTEAPAKWVCLIEADEFALGSFYGSRFWFFVPDDCEGFRIGAKPSNRSCRWGFAVYDGKDRLAGHKSWYYSSHLGGSTMEWLEVKAPADVRGTWWNIPYSCRKDLTFVWPKELPRYLTDSSSSGFIPDADALKKAVSIAK